MADDAAAVTRPARYHQGKVDGALLSRRRVLDHGLFGDVRFARSGLPEIGDERSVRAEFGVRLAFPLRPSALRRTSHRAHTPQGAAAASHRAEDDESAVRRPDRPAAFGEVMRQLPRRAARRRCRSRSPRWVPPRARDRLSTIRQAERGAQVAGIPGHRHAVDTSRVGAVRVAAVQISWPFLSNTSRSPSVENCGFSPNSRRRLALPPNGGTDQSP